jgi:hypothetical protein
VFAGEQPAFAIPGQAVRLVARISELDDTAIRGPAAYPAPRHVAEQQLVGWAEHSETRVLLPRQSGLIIQNEVPQAVPGRGYDGLSHRKCLVETQL